MKIEKLKESPTELEIKVDDGGHTLFNLLQKVLLEDKDVEFAGYDIPHPLSSSSIIHVRTKGAVTPKEALVRAVKKIRQFNEDFKKEFVAAVKEK